MELKTLQPGFLAFVISRENALEVWARGRFFTGEEGGMHFEAGWYGDLQVRDLLRRDGIIG
jgi:hypothetical protein